MIKGGPKIINDGLVLCLDAHDAKSYAGEPTTNLLGSNDNPLNGISGISLTKIETQADGWIKYSMSGTFTGGSYPYICVIDSVSFTGGTAYTSRAMIKTNVESKFNYFGTNGINYVNQPKDAEGTSRSVVTEENGFNVYTVSKEGFIYTSTTTQGGYLFTNPINNTTFNSSTDFMWIKNVQVEQKTYPTPWTYTSRSATNGWVDRSGNSNSGTLTNMAGTGASHYRDGQVIMPVANSYLDFDGSNDELRLTSYNDLRFGDSGYSDNFSIEVWFKLDTVARSPLYDYYRYGLQVGSSDGTIGLWYNGNGGTWGGSGYGGSISAGVWYHGLGVHSEGNHDTVYLNGTAVSTDSTPVDIGSSTYPWSSYPYVGHTDHVGGVFTNGQIAVVRVYNKALTAAEVLSNYNATKGRFL